MPNPVEFPEEADAWTVRPTNPPTIVAHRRDGSVIFRVQTTSKGLTVLMAESALWMVRSTDGQGR